LQVLVNFGVSRVIASGHPDFKVGDLVWGMTGWEEYTLVPKPESFFKIHHPEFPLSYYAGVLGELYANQTLHLEYLPPTLNKIIPYSFLFVPFI
jgi:NADPH-dependent curcumin reductase CurA